MDSAGAADWSYKHERACGKKGCQMVDDVQSNNLSSPSIGPSGGSPGQGAFPGSKFYFDVPFEQKDTAKAAGLRWDAAIRRWYADDAEIAKAFSLSAELNTDAPVQTQRTYYNVPFLQKDRAKAIGMRFDGARKLWFAPSAAVSDNAARIFEGVIRPVDQDSPV